MPPSVKIVKYDFSDINKIVNRYSELVLVIHQYVRDIPSTISWTPNIAASVGDKLMLTTMRNFLKVSLVLATPQCLYAKSES